MQASAVEKRIYATVFISEGGCMVAINPLPVKTNFFFQNDRLMTGNGQEIVIVHNAARQRVLDMAIEAPDKVFVAEIGPMGAIAEHAISPAAVPVMAG